MSIANLRSAPVPHKASAVRKSASVSEFVVKPVVRAVQTTLVLTEIAIPEDVLEAMAPGLRELGCTVETGSIEDTVGGEKIVYRFTLIEKGSERVAIHLADEILGISDLETRRAIGELRDLFKARFGRGVVLYVIHESDPHPNHVFLMEIEWPDLHDVACKFVPLRQLADVGQVGGVDKQAALLKSKLDLDEPPAGPPAVPPAGDPAPAVPAKASSIHMPMSEIKRLAGMIAARSEFKDEGARGRRVFVEMADLRDFADGFDFEGKSKTVAFILVSELLDNGLKLLLETMKDLGDLAEADKNFISRLLQRYSFS